MVRRCCLVLLALVLMLAPGARAQGSPTPSPSPSPPEVVPVPLADVAERASEVSAWLRAMDATLQDSASVQAARTGLAPLTRDLKQHVKQNERILVDQPTVETLRGREVALKDLSTTLGRWKRSLSDRGAVLEDLTRQLDGMREVWSATSTRALTEAAAPEIQSGIDRVMASLEEARKRVQVEQGDLFALQNELADRETQLAEALAALARARESTVDRTLAQDSPPLWQLGEFLTLPELKARLLASLSTQRAELKEYSRSRAPRLAAGFVIFGLILLGMRWARRRTARWVESDPDLEKVARIFESSAAAALLLTVAVVRAGDSSAPRMYLALLGMVVLLPAVMMLRRLLDPYLQPLLGILMLFFLLDQGRLITAAVPVLARVLLLGETLAGMVCLAWYLRPSRFESVPDPHRAQVLARTFLLVRVALALFSASTVANVFGFLALANVLASATLRSAYTGLFLMATLRVMQGVAVFMLHVPPLALSRAVRGHQAMLSRRIGRLLRFLALFLWVVAVLEFFSVRELVVRVLAAVLSADLSVGTLSLSLGGVLTFFLAVWAATQVSRFLRFVLEEDVFPRLPLHRGTPHALSMTLHYALLLLGLLVAMAALGMDLTKFTVLAGALGVGIGFGLQNIVNNFVSGLILLFDPSMDLGDPIQFGAHQGELVSIGMRASSVRLLDGRELIVPNSDLIQQQVINGTPSRLQPRRIDITFALAEPCEGRPVLDLLSYVARAHPDVVAIPEPLGLFLGYIDGTPTYQLLAWTRDSARAHLIRSDLALHLGEALNAQGYRVSGPRRDVRLVESAKPD